MVFEEILKILEIKQLHFKEVSYDDCEVLFNLLKRRVHSISHGKIPTKKEHRAFVKAHPYRYWAIIIRDGYPIGSFYLQEDNSIGLNILEYSQEIFIEIIGFIRENFKPNKEVKSKVPPYFYINAAYDNEKLNEMLLESEVTPIQVSYKI